MRLCSRVFIAAAFILSGALAWADGIHNPSASTMGDFDGIVSSARIAPPAFQGVGDVVSGAIAWGSCARAYNAAYANGTNPLCDLKDKTTGTVAICTLRVLTTGFVDLAASYCTGSATPAVACAAAAGGSCVVSKVYDQTGTGNHFTQATLSAMPALTFSALNGLPGLSGTNAASTQLTTVALTQAQPFSFTAVAERTGTQTIVGGPIGTSTTSGGISFNNTASTSFTDAAAFLAGPTSTDNVFHAFAAVNNSTTSAIVVDATANTGNSGTQGFSANNLSFFQSNGGVMTGLVMEAGMWPSAFNATQYGNLNTNAHSAANGYNF